MKKYILIFAAMIIFDFNTACAQNNPDPQSAAIDPRSKEEIKVTARQSAKEIKRLAQEFKDFYNELKDIVKEEGIADLGEDIPSQGLGRTDIVDEEKVMVVTVDMPGIKKDRVNVRLLNEKLLEISARADVPGQNQEFVRNERQKGEFSRQLDLPEEAADGKIEAKMEDGVLTVRVPKKTPGLSQKIREIPVL